MLSNCEENSVLTDQSLKHCSDDTKFLVSPIVDLVAVPVSRSAPMKLKKKGSVR